MNKQIIFTLSVFVLLVLGIVGVKVFAQTISSVASPAPVATSPMIVNINPSGNVLMRGVVESVGADYLMLKSWGGNWKVKISSSTQLISLNSAFIDFQVDDFAGVLGTIAEDGSFVVNAKILREWGKKVDHDKDGIPDSEDEDDDNDGIPDASDASGRDHDNDGISDDSDTDDDDDGIDDSNDSKGKNYDHDNDGIVDSDDADDDNDGISDDKDLKKNDHDNDGEKDDEDEDDGDDDNDGEDDADSGSDSEDSD